ncbi:transposase [Moorena producens 3L]|uniref:Transposase n=1 Tax=Moorena producens 3L TaxID=489825 RepID=F4Y475_9CYAN|nr:transposase [Moorena producens 3L]
MPYSLDFRKKVIKYIEKGGNITEAAKVFGIGIATIYKWLNRSELKATKVERRQRKLDWKALEQDVKENPDAKLIERAKKFGVRPSAIFYALKKMKITRKKKELRYRESDAARSWGFPPETKPDYVEPLWLVGYAKKG